MLVNRGLTEYGTRSSLKVDSIKPEPASNDTISMRSPSSNAKTCGKKNYPRSPTKNYTRFMLVKIFFVRNIEIIGIQFVPAVPFSAFRTSSCPLKVLFCTFIIFGSWDFGKIYEAIYIRRCFAYDIFLYTTVSAMQKRLCQWWM